MKTLEELRIRSGKYLKNYNHFYLVTLFLIAIRFIAVFWNVDTYHEGDKYPSIIEMAQGGVIFRDVNHIYGFLMTIINFPLVRFFGNYLIITRISGFIIQMLLVLISYKLFRIFVSLSVSRNLTLLMLGISNAWSWINPNIGASGNTWPTHYGMLFVSCSLLLIIQKPKSSKAGVVIFGVAGFLSAVAWSARLEFLSVWFLQTLAIAWIVFQHKSVKFQSLMSWLFGSLGYFCISLFLMQMSGSLEGWFEQTIKVWYSDPPAQPSFNLGWLVINGFSFFAVMALPIMIYFISYQALKSNWNLSKQAFAISGIFILWILIGVAFSDLTIGKYPVNAWVLGVIERGLFGFASVFVFVFVLSLVFAKNKIIKNAYSSLSVQDKSQFVIVSSTCAGLLSLFHIVNADYLFMSITPFVCFFLLVAGKLLPNYDKETFFNALNLSCKIIVILSVMLFVPKTIASDNYKYKTPLLKGMIDQDFVRGIRTDQNFYSIKKAVGNGKLWTFCLSGLYSVTDRGFISEDKWVWNLEPESWMVPRIEKPRKGDVMLVCNLSMGEKKIFDRRLASGEFALLENLYGMDLYTVIK
jgi:hypothetical protein